LELTRVGARVEAGEVVGRVGDEFERLAEAVIEVPTTGTRQFGGTRFEQGALLLLDSVVLDLTAADQRVPMA
jgi:hypothetical protein